MSLGLLFLFGLYLQGLDSKSLDEPAYPPAAYEEAARSSNSTIYTDNYNCESIIQKGKKCWMSHFNPSTLFIFFILATYPMMMPLGLPIPQSVYQYPSLQRLPVPLPPLQC